MFKISQEDHRIVLYDNVMIRNLSLLGERNDHYLEFEFVYYIIFLI